MKKIILAIAIVLTLSLTTNAQRDGFFANYDNIYDDRGESAINLSLPNSGGLISGGSYGADETAPLGTGLLILTALGAGYAVAKHRKK